MNYKSIRSFLGHLWYPPSLARVLLQKATRSALNDRSSGKLLEIGASTLYSTQKLISCTSYVSVDVNLAAKPSAVADVHQLPCEDGVFDTVVMLEVLEHCREPAQALNECRRVLVNNGELLMSTRFLHPQHDAPYDYFRFTEGSLRYLLRDWESSNISPLGNRASTILDLLSGKSRVLRWIFGPCGVLIKGSNVFAGGFFVSVRK